MLFPRTRDLSLYALTEKRGGVVREEGVEVHDRRDVALSTVSPLKSQR